MAPLGAAEKAALDGFFKSKRGSRALRPAVALAMTNYFAANGTTLPELGQRAADKRASWADWALHTFCFRGVGRAELPI